MHWTKPYSRETLSLPLGPFETERLILRPQTHSDIDCMWEMDSNPNVMRYILPHYEDEAEFRAEMVRDFETGRFKFMYTIVLKETDEPLGWLLFRPTEDGKWIEMGWRLVERAWGNGYVPEAAKLVLDMGFRDLGLDEVMAVLMPENKASARVTEKLGFKYEGTRFFYDMDLAFYRFTRPKNP